MQMQQRNRADRARTRCVRLLEQIAREDPVPHVRTKRLFLFPGCFLCARGRCQVIALARVRSIIWPLIKHGNRLEYVPQPRARDNQREAARVRTWCVPAGRTMRRPRTRGTAREAVRTYDMSSIEVAMPRGRARSALPS